MNKQQLKPLKDLNLTSRFLYDAVMEDAETTRAALSIIFGKDIPLLSWNESEKEFRISPLMRSIRMDIVSFDADGNVYDSEMQGEQKPDLPKRSRYYQALLDTGLLEPGIPNYNVLNDSFIIFIMPFDLFGYGKYRYTFTSKCMEVPDLRLPDGATRIFLNTRGKNEAEVSKELVDFLHYLENTTDENARESDSERIRQIHKQVCKVKQSEEVGMRYLRELEEKYYAKQEGIEQGIEKGIEQGIEKGIEQGEYLHLISLVQKKIARGKSLQASADELEMDCNELRTIYQTVQHHPENSPEDILKLLNTLTEEKETAAL